MIATAMHPVLGGSPYQAYVYAYPHKTAYRPLPTPRPLRDVWCDEPRSGLFLYMHVPFCTMRCGFCNLFTTPNPEAGLTALYLDALRRQADVVRAAIPDARFARFAIGGGTPTYLDEAGLETVFDIAALMTQADLAQIPSSIETSPDTLTPGKVALFEANGVERVSIGVQSFVESETANSGRPQTPTSVHAALSLLADSRIPTVNIDLIYGLPGQSVDSWLYSIRQALKYAPGELYLYPLYVRPLTGLGRSRKQWDDLRQSCYREGRDLLMAEGYEQVSMRMFKRVGWVEAWRGPPVGDGGPRKASTHPTQHGGPVGDGGPRQASTHPTQHGGPVGDGGPRKASTHPTQHGGPVPVEAEAQRGRRGEAASRVSASLRFGLHPPQPSTNGGLRKASTHPTKPAYCCQEDGMVGLGCGARSYTRSLHYSLDYAVGAKGVREIIADYLAREPGEFAVAEHGFELDADEQRRRYLLQSILNVEGLDEARYAARFGSQPDDDFPDLRTLADLGLLKYDDGRWSPTPLGLERSDAIGPWFFSKRVQGLMAEYDPK